MPIVRLKIPLAGAVLLMAGLAGCTGNSDKDRSQKPLVNSPAAPPESTATLHPKKADLPDPPEEAGPIDQDAPEEFTATRTGLYYRILRKSRGRKPRSFDTVIAHYKGWLDNGKQFDSSYERSEPATFPLNGVVAGWTEGLQFVGEGGMIELEIPGKLGYGPQGRPPNIPPNATLHFIIELKKIK
jgi:FKBP-type peptidyl-prolyl cis-trans isomerase FkpA